MTAAVTRPRRSLVGLTAASLGVAAALAGCRVGPDYLAPQSQFRPFHNLAAVGALNAATAPPLDRWWIGFNDPMLVIIVQRALAQNLDLAASLARVRQARAAAASAGAQLLPTVDLDASAMVEHQSLEGPFGEVSQEIPGYRRDQREYTFGPAASWEIDLFGGLRRNAQAAREETQAAEADRAGTRITIASDAADAYLQVRGDQARLAVAQDQIDTDAHLLSLVRARHNAGQADGREIAQADALMRQARATVPPLRIALEAQSNRLDVLMGVQPGTYSQELGRPGDIPAVPAIGTDETPLDLMRRRPDIIAAERRLAASNEQIGAAISDYYPKISLSGALGFDSLSINHLFTAKAFQPVGAGALKWRLFDFGKIDAEVEQARGGQAEALAHYRQAALKAAEDVENSLILLSQTTAHVKDLQGEVDSLTRARDLSQRAYQAGSITLTDVLDADRQLLIARDDLDTNRAQAAQAAVGTFRALGGGWKGPERLQAAAGPCGEPSWRASQKCVGN